MSLAKPCIESSSQPARGELDAESNNDPKDFLYMSGIQPNPQASNTPDDPLNWPMWLKVAILTQTSLLAAIGGLNTATINPALAKVAKEFDISIIRASYQTTVCIALNGIAPWIWIPFAHRYGRRPIYLITTAIAFVSILCCAYTHTFTQLLVARVFNGIFPVGFALGAATVTDLFYIEQRGRAMGFFTVSVVNGSHLAPIIGGLLGEYCGWRWIFKFLAIVDAVLFVVAFFFLPETQYIRRECQNAVVAPVTSNTSTSTTSTTSTAGLLPSRPRASPRTQMTKKAFINRLRFFSPNPTYRIHLTDFVLPTLRMASYPSVIFPAIYYAAMYGFASILPAVTVAAIFTEYFHWSTLRIGVSFGTSLTIGGILGEAVSGWVCDLLLKRAAKRAILTKTTLAPEVRLKPIWAGEIITVAGLLMYGFTLQRHRTWVLPIVAMGISCFGLQIITTTTYTYAIDVHRGRSAEVAQLFNFVRQMFGMTFAFYVVRMGMKIGFQWTFLIFAVCGGVLAFAPVLGLMLYGKSWRRWANEKWGRAD